MRTPGTRTRRQLLAQARIRAPRWAPGTRVAGIDREVVVSLTTYPGRSEVSWQSIRTLLRQSARADRVVLSLFEGDFPGRQLPPRLAPLQDEGVELLWSAENARSHLKLLPVLQRYPDALVVTADDDTLYPWRWLAGLLHAHRQDPSAILTYRAYEMQLDGPQAVRPYDSWPRATPTSSWRRVFPTGVAGVLYPPGALAQDAFDLGLVRELCPTADDIWFKAMSLLNGTRSVAMATRPEDPIVVLRSQHEALMQVNHGQSANDAQVQRVFAHFDLFSALGT